MYIIGTKILLLMRHGCKLKFMMENASRVYVRFIERKISSHVLRKFSLAYLDPYVVAFAFHNIVSTCLP